MGEPDTYPFRLFFSFFDFAPFGLHILVLILIINNINIKIYINLLVGGLLEAVIYDRFPEKIIILML